jgi:hypothetical protein
MFTKTRLNALLVIGALFPFALAQAATITFEDVSLSIGPTTAPFTSGGYSFSYTPGDTPGGIHGVTNLSYRGDGSNYLVYESGVGTETFSSLSGAFNLTSLDLEGGLNFPSTANLTITGTRFDNTTVTYTAPIEPAVFKPYVLNDFTNLRSVTLGSIKGGAYIAVDNIQVSPVPEPQTYAMLLAGMAMLAGVARYRKAILKGGRQD